MNVVHSGMTEAPIIGFVTQDADWGGEVVIPKDTEVHGHAQFDRVRNRIQSQNRWILVWPTGEELAVSGTAMTRVYDPVKRVWGPDDATPGLAGQIVTSTSFNEFKFFLAEALSAFAVGMQQQNTTVLGIEHTPANARNAALAATSQLLNTYAQQVLETIKSDGFCVVVPPTQFYVYLNEPVDWQKARIAGTRPPPEAKTAAERRTAGITNAQLAQTVTLPPATPPPAPLVPRSR